MKFHLRNSICIINRFPVDLRRTREHVPCNLDKSDKVTIDMYSPPFFFPTLNSGQINVAFKNITNNSLSCKSENRSTVGPPQAPLLTPSEESQGSRWPLAVVRFSLTQLFEDDLL